MLENASHFLADGHSPHPLVPFCSVDSASRTTAQNVTAAFLIAYTNCACTAVSATTPTISDQEQPLERSFTGFAIPWSIGP